MVNVQDRIKELRNTRKVTQKQLADALGVENQSVSQWEKKGLFDLVRLKQIADYFGVDIDYLIKDEVELSSKASLIAYWGNVDVTGGKVILDNNSDTRPTGFIQLPGFEDCEHAVNHYGDSMSPYINGGDVILLKNIENWMDYIPFGEVFLVVTNTLRTVKYVRKSPNPNNFLLIPHNEKYDAFEVPKSEVLQMFLVKGSVQRKLL